MIYLLCNSPASERVFGDLLGALLAKDECVKIENIAPANVSDGYAKNGISIRRRLLCAARDLVPSNLYGVVKMLYLSVIYLVKFKRMNVKLLVVPDDRSFGSLMAASFSARLIKIHVFLVPVAHWLNGDGLLSMRKGRSEYLCSGSSCKFSMELEGEECYSFYKKGDRAAASIFTSTDHNPWVMGAGYSTVVSVESNEIKGVLKDAVREDAKNIVVTGNIQHDNVYKLNKLPLCEDRTKSVLVALPQFYEHGMCSWEYQQKFVSDLVQVLDPMFDQIDISLHPSMLRNDYEFLESDRIVILDENFSKIVNYYKVIVCTFSSVVVWSRLLGKFVVVVDPLNLAYSQRYFPYNLYCRQSSELNALSKITFDEKSEYLNLIRGNYKFDGNALKRTVQLIQEYR